MGVDSSGGVSENSRLRTVVAWLTSPGVLKAAAFVLVLAFTIRFLSKYKADQIAARRFVPPRIAWLRGTSDPRLQQALATDEGQEVAELIEEVPKASIRDNIVERLAFDKTLRSLAAFIEKGWSVEGPAKDGRPLLNAVRSGQPKALGVLLEHGANPNVKDSEGRSAVVLACQNPRAGHRLLELLHAHGAQIDTPVIRTFRRRDKPSAFTKVAIRPLHVAIEYDNMRALGMLLKLGANPNQVPDESSAPIMQAVVINDTFRATRILVEAGAKVNILNRAYYPDSANPNPQPVNTTALHLHAFRNNPLTVKYLLEHGADPTIEDSLGKTALEVAKGEALQILKAHTSGKATTQPKISAH